MKAAQDMVRAESAAVRQVAGQINDTMLEMAAHLLNQAGKTLIAGVGTSGAVARRMAHLLAVSGTPALFIHPTDALHGALGAVTGGDTVIAISKGGRSTELNEFATRARTRGAYVVAITADNASPLAGLADLTVHLVSPVEADPGGVIAMGSTLAVSAWGDALAVVLMRMRGYAWSDVLFTHPAGAVGAHTDLPPALAPLAPTVPDTTPNTGPGSGSNAPVRGQGTTTLRPPVDTRPETRE